MTDGNRLVRTRMLGGVGGAGSIPAPTRLGLVLHWTRVNSPTTCIDERFNPFLVNEIIVNIPELGR